MFETQNKTYVCLQKTEGIGLDQVLTMREK